MSGSSAASDVDRGKIIGALLANVRLLLAPFCRMCDYCWRPFGECATFVAPLWALFDIYLPLLPERTAISCAIFFQVRIYFLPSTCLTSYNFRIFCLPLPLICISYPPPPPMFSYASLLFNN